MSRYVPPKRAFRADLARFRARLQDRAKWGPRRNPAERVRWGEAEQRNERVFTPAGAETRDMELATTRSRRKPWRFCCAWAVTSARSAGGFRGWSWRCSDQPDLRLALFFLKSRLNPRCDRLSGGADAIRRGF